MLCFHVLSHVEYEHPKDLVINCDSNSEWNVTISGKIVRNFPAIGKLQISLIYCFDTYYAASQISKT